ncbi:DUF1298 domain-containing protein [Rhodococcus sp. BP-149]|uniref:wax ester/triacylglycerol synthase domain-containing protein n=1 Tax=unclassified Rhodococcus (in: high G+C Gram-positive bacteria) TaxID=192944 RepID=UPI001C9B1123|nr:MULTISPECIES: wax ester/triacylglycerol synthase domain-containing protein [unclassified Rhodococcus (in: high G+C Gram-positive bacteria)]MBY6685106.1 DUF1298 domain-containing protein [Rhodococcus sp. BP-288]MBY6692410.1 DUF1298 domain-containing protein [Rhodococcus sp. BP-188]MBY6698308.1 DUF1298 domain-containing protein [Rhodococcus sp. BP-285]MBY6700987.1 DUF1298 domain-containing protein [Rhodococcus sp. BP-283]MBY6711988.1 DUF1298 domain-containing protein [Rhodococcus sp. BP-160]
MTRFRQPFIGVRVSPRDAINVLAESERVIANLVDVMVFDAAGTMGASPTHATVCAWMRGRLDVSPVFRRRLRRRAGDLGDPFWVTGDVDLDDHVVVTPIDRPGWDPVERHIARVMATPMTLASSGWELHVLTGIHGVPHLPEGATAVVIEVHHASMDGLGLVAVVRALFASPDLSHDGRVAERRGTAVPGPIPPLWKDAATMPRRTAMFVRTMAAVRRAAPETPRPPRPATRFNARIALDHRVRIVWLDLAHVRTISRAVPGITVNDVLLTAVSLALTQFLDQAGEHPAATLSTTMPLDIHATHDTAAANQTTFADVDLHTTVVDPLLRLRAVHASAADAKRRVQDLTSRHEVSPFDVAPPLLLRAIGALSTLAPHDRPTVPSTTVVSNMPHGSDDLWFLGARAVAAFMPMPTVDGMGLIHHITSLGDRLALTVTVESTMMAEPDRYCAMIRDAVDALAAATLDDVAAPRAAAPASVDTD